jgi:uncharacterized repeat protein (TIGR02543 family)
MEKIGLKLTIIFVLCGLLCTAVFAQDGDAAQSGGGAGAEKEETTTQTTQSEKPPAQPAKPPTQAAKTPAKSPAQTSKQPAQAAKPPAQPQKFTVTFDTNGGSAIASVEVEKEKTIGELPDAPEKDGFQFGGWWTKKNDTETAFTKDTPVTADITVHAMWNPIQTMSDTQDNKDVDMTQINDKPEETKNPMLSLSFPLLLSAAGAALFLIILALFNFIAVCGIRKKIRFDMRKQFDELAEKQNAAKNAIIEKIGNRPQLSENTRNISEQDSARITDLQTQIERLKSENANYQNRIQALEKDLQIAKEDRKIANAMNNGSLNVKDVFNNWASNPSTSLPKAFWYIEGDMKIRSPRDLKESLTGADSKWISNREGTKKYLFPNPNSFNQMTNISELYRMDMSKLKAKGQNRIKITNPCEMTKDGFVEFPGELEIL